MFCSRLFPTNSSWTSLHPSTTLHDTGPGHLYGTVSSVQGIKLAIIKTILRDLIDPARNGIEQDMRVWRKKISDAVFYFFSIFGLVTYIPSVVLSIREGYYQVAALSTVLYIACLLLTFIRKIDYHVKAVSGAVLFYIVGAVLQFVLGPKGAGAIWLFATTILVALLLGNRGALFALVGVVLIQIGFYIMLRMDVVRWYDQFGITPDMWVVKSVNFILLNFVILIANGIFVRGFKTLVARSTETRNASIIGLAKLAEYRDNDTGQHLQRIQEYVVLIARELARQEKYREYITEEYIQDLYTSSILHDIGKVGIQDAILLKPGALTPEEFAIIKQHPVMGGDVIAEIENHIQGRSFYALGREIARYHHEKWDGSGYPEGLQGEEIPLSARITALADVYDALTSERPYKDASSHEEAVRVIKSGRGTQFDPEVVDAFVRIMIRSPKCVF